MTAAVYLAGAALTAAVWLAYAVTASERPRSWLAAAAVVTVTIALFPLAWLAFGLQLITETIEDARRERLGEEE